MGKFENYVNYYVNNVISYWRVSVTKTGVFSRKEREKERKIEKRTK